MRKRHMLCLVLLASSIGLQAQGAGQTEGKTTDANTFQGCLQNSRGVYTLTEENGATHQLVGAANKLGRQVGRQIEVTASRASGWLTARLWVRHQPHLSRKCLK